MENKKKIIILPQERQLKTTSGQNLLETLIRNGIFLRTDCGGKGKCGKCLIEKVSNDGTSQTIKSCQYKVEQTISIKVPRSSMASVFIMDKPAAVFPETFKNLFDSNSLINTYGIAIDLGTTTIAVYLCDITRGKVMSSVFVKNAQGLYGEDVMSRIGFIGNHCENLGRLQALVTKGIEWGIQKLLSAFDGENALLPKAVVVGNPAMIHIFAGIDPASIGVSPYEPAFYDSRVFQSNALGIDMGDMPIRTLPNVSGFIGGDIIAASLAVEIKSQPDGTLLIDLGTNGELLLKSGKKLYATSCATGPAFEGAALSCGMQAVPGAITSITINDKMKASDIRIINPANSNGLGASGICGPGAINVVAQLHEKQIIKPDGAFKSGEEKFVLVPGDNETDQAQVYISQKDIRAIQLGKSALMTGIEFLLRKAGLKKPEKIIIAGAFGSNLNKADLIRLGMIPEIALDKIEVVGNAAGSGAVMALCKNRYVDEAVETASKMEVVDLACDVDFQEMFIANLSFPSG